MSEGELVQLREGTPEGFSVATIEACFPVKDGAEGLEGALDDLCAAAVAAADEGCQALVVSDRSTDEARAPIPMLLAVSTVHNHLIRKGLRMRSSIVADTGDARGCSPLRYADRVRGFGDLSLPRLQEPGGVGRSRGVRGPGTR